MKLKVKVCGMRDPKNIREVLAVQPDYMGFIFYPGSRRYVGSKFKIASFPSSCKKVGVFVNEPLDSILRPAQKYKLAGIQLHGEESPELCRSVKAEGYEVIKAIHVHSNTDFSETTSYEEVVNYFLFDTATGNYGGSGKTFDWRSLGRYNQKVPFFLSGGISPQNVSGVSVLAGMNIHAIDVNSGVERSPAVKELTLINELYNKLKAI